eukprot:2949715-Pyramimonas_sp.AAC.1
MSEPWPEELGVVLRAASSWSKVMGSRPGRSASARGRNFCICALVSWYSSCLVHLALRCLALVSTALCKLAITPLLS